MKRDMGLLMRKTRKSFLKKLMGFLKMICAFGFLEG